MGDPDTHRNVEKHGLYLREQILYCEDCETTFASNEFDDEMNNMLIGIGTAIAEKLASII